MTAQPDASVVPVRVSEGPVTVTGWFGLGSPAASTTPTAMNDAVPGTPVPLAGANLAYETTGWVVPIPGQVTATVTDSVG